MSFRARARPPPASGLEVGLVGLQEFPRDLDELQPKRPASVLSSVQPDVVESA
jgi:hypothetical protein